MGRKKHKVTRGRILIVIVVVAVVAFVGMDIFSDELSDSPSGSSTKSHECISDTMDAGIAEDGSLHVVDAREYKFTGTYSLTAAILDPPESGSAIVNGVSVVDADGTRSSLTEVPFNTLWRTMGGPGSGYYSYDSEKKTLYAFSNTSDATKTFVFDYTYTNAVDRYDDCSVLYWQFIPEGWDVDTNNVNATLTLPVPSGQTVSGGSNVIAYGHGDLSGSVAFNDDGTISYTIPRVKSGTFAEMRVAFPSSWTPSVPSAKTHASSQWDSIMEEEAGWQREAQLKRIASALLLVVPLLLSVALIVASIVMFRRHGKEHKPEFQGEYWRDVPAKGVHPAVVGRIWRWNEEDPNDLIVTMMHLGNQHVVSIDAEQSVRQRKILGDKVETTYRLTYHEDKAAGLGRIDCKALDAMFKHFSGNTFTLSELQEYAKEHAEQFMDGVKRWESAVDDEVGKHRYFELEGERYKFLMLLISVGIAVVAAVASVFLENFAPLLGLLPGCVVMFAFSFFMPRRSRDAVEIHARCEALKKWFEDFTALDKAVPTDAKVWGELMVYAYLFGVSDRVAEQLSQINPDIWDDAAFASTVYWYHTPYGYAAGPTGASTGDFFHDAFDNTFASAQAAIDAATAKDVASDMFSGGGGGGGFSGGGGGGFGGGGGGFSR